MAVLSASGNWRLGNDGAQLYVNHCGFATKFTFIRTIITTMSVGLGFHEDIFQKTTC